MESTTRPRRPSTGTRRISTRSGGSASPEDELGNAVRATEEQIQQQKQQQQEQPPIPLTRLNSATNSLAPSEKENLGSKQENTNKGKGSSSNSSGSSKKSKGGSQKKTNKKDGQSIKAMVSDNSIKEILDDEIEGEGSGSTSAMSANEINHGEDLITATKPKKGAPSFSKVSKFQLFVHRHPWIMGWNHEDWWSCWIGLFLFGCIALAVHHNVPQAHFQPWSNNPFESLATVANLGLLVLTPGLGLLVWLALWSIGAKNWQKFPQGYAVIYSVAFVSKWLAAQENIKAASLGDSIWAIMFGAVLRNVMAGRPMPDGRSRPLPPWLKVAQQTELYIATSLVLLCIDFTVLKPLAPRALFVSWIDTPSLFVLVAVLGATWLGIDLQTAMIMSGATFICGSSAAIAISASLGAGSKADLPIAIISVFTIPSIIALPYIATAIKLSAQVSGAWFGGCVDSTGAVIAAATIYSGVTEDKTAIDVAAVVKMCQNVLIGPISVGVAAVWSHREERRRAEIRETLEDDATRAKTEYRPVPYSTLLWSRFPKFVLGFTATAILFNTAVPSVDRVGVNQFCFMVGEFFSTMSFVSIGLGLQFHELRREAKLLLQLTTLYAIAQIVDILSTLGLAYVAFELF